MKFVSTLLLGCLSLFPMSVQADMPSYLKDLDEQGYCVIPNVVSRAEAEILYKRVWHEFIEKAWPNCKMDDRSNWKEAFPKHNQVGIFAGPAGQTQVMWDLRQDPRIVDVYAKLWNTSDLIVSMDGLSFMCPPEIREGYFRPWPHVDQAVLKRHDNAVHDNNSPEAFVSESHLKSKPYTVQGQFLFEDSCEGDGGFYCVPKSHLLFNEFAPGLEMITASLTPTSDKGIAREKFVREFFYGRLDESGRPYYAKHVTAERGSLILWDSRTIHWNQHAANDRAYSENPRVRMVGYLCYVPKARQGAESRARRREAFEKGVSTGHNPVNPELKYTNLHMRPNLVQYLEDPSYTQPKINLTPLGEFLLGINE